MTLNTFEDRPVTRRLAEGFVEKKPQKHRHSYRTMLHLRSNSLFVGVLGASIITAGISPQANAQIYSEIRLNGRATSFNSAGPFILGSNIDITQRDGPPSSISKSSSAGPAQLDLSAEFAPGIIRARASGQARSVDLGEGLTGSSDWDGLVQVGTSEELNLAVPGHGVGERATLRYSFYVPGNLSLSTQGSAAGDARVVFASSSGHFSDVGMLSIEGVRQYVVSGADYPGTLNDSFENPLPSDRIITYERQITLGTPFLVSQLLQITVSGRGAFGAPAVGLPAGSVEIDADFSHSAYWNGVSSLSIDGNNISDFSLVNSDGIDFRHSFTTVPEPKSYGTVAAVALIIFDFVRRFRRSRENA